MFEDEVNQALDAGWGGPKGAVTTVGAARDSAGNAADTSNGSIARMWRVGVAAKPDRFKTLWFDDNLNDKIKKDGGAARPDPDGLGSFVATDSTDATADNVANAMHDLYNNNDNPATDTNEDPATSR